MFQSYYFFKYESVLIPYYLSIKHSFRTWQFSINFFPKFSPKRKLVKTKNILNEFYFLVLFADSSRCHKLPYNVRAVVSGRQCCATNAIKSIRGPVACSNRRKGGEKKKRKQSPREFIFCLYCVCTMKITRRYEWTPRYTLAIRSSGFLQGSLKVSLFWNFPLKMFDG